MDRSTSDSASLLDRAAIALSGLCVLHCLAIPIVLLALPFLGQLAPDHFHLQMLVVVVPVSSIALGLGFRRHRRLPVLVAGTIGLMLLFVGGTWIHNEIGVVADRIATIAGSLFLASAHFYNSRFSRCHSSVCAYPGRSLTR
jgi:MerC mercury resistance protein